MSAATCAQPGVHHADCQCTVTGVPTIGVPHLPVMRDATAGPMHPPCGDPACPGPHAIPEAPAPTVVCASCGRTIDRAGTDSCELPDWHQPQPYVRDADVTAEDGDDLVPMDDDAWQAAVGPQPGQTWADLYGRTHVALSYKGAQLEGVTRELVRVRKLLAESVAAYDALVRDTMRHLAAIVRRHGSELATGGHELRVPMSELEAAPGEVTWWDDQLPRDRVWQVRP